MDADNSIKMSCIKETGNILKIEVRSGMSIERHTNVSLITRKFNRAFRYKRALLQMR